MKPLADVLQGLSFPNLGITITTQPTPIDWMLGLPPTDDVLKRLDLIDAGRREKISREKMDLMVWMSGYKITDGVILARCRERDALQATRPSGCWCLGVGWRRKDHGYSYEAVQVAALDTLNDYCRCKDGIRARSDHHSRLAGYRQQQHAEKTERLWAAVGVPARYDAWTLATMIDLHPERTEQVDFLRGWEADAGARSDTGELCDWLLLYGPVGRGKTGLMISLLKRAVQRGIGALFCDVPVLLERIRATYDPTSEERELGVLQPLLDVPLLGLDDLGAHGYSSWVIDKLRLLVNQRYINERRTIVTTNIAVEALVERFDDRMASRLFQASTVYLVDGANLRDH